VFFIYVFKVVLFPSYFLSLLILFPKNINFRQNSIVLVISYIFGFLIYTNVYSSVARLQLKGKKSPHKFLTLTYIQLLLDNV